MVKKLYIFLFICFTFFLSSGFVRSQPYITSSYGLIENSSWESNLTAVRFSATVLGDLNGDDYPDLILTGCLSDGASDCNHGAISKVYINNGTTFNENLTWQQNLTGAGYGSLALGDINNDGYLDLALSGCPTGTEASCDNIFSKIYINNGTSFVESSQWQSNLTGVYSGSTKFVDINNDGLLDLALTGRASLTRISKIYINNGTSFVESSQWQSNLTGVRYSSLAFADIDNDGDLDLALTGVDSGSNNNGKIYLNNGTSLIYDSVWSINLLATNLGSLIFGDYNNDGKIDLIETGIGDYLYTFNNTGLTFIINQKNSGAGGDLGGGRYEGSSAFGDYNNDGNLDFVATGYEEGRSSLYYNNNSNFFIIDKGAGKGIHNVDMHQDSLVWADLDNDKDLDLINIGVNITSDIQALIFISNVSLTTPNTLPTPPSTFTSSYAGNQLLLTWNNGSDAETPSNGLYYNIMVGNSTTNNTVVSGIYGGSSGGGNAGGGADGYFGNMMQRKNITLDVQLNASETYHWYVQTIDTGLAKSSWSAAQNFTTSSDVTKPTVTVNPSSPDDGTYTTNPAFVFNASVIDANVANVTLYANWTGSMILNETNSSAISANYSFSKNLNGYSDGMYSWYIYACDTSSNCQSSGTRTFYLDRTYPLVYLESPASGDTWSSSSTVTFSYNVTDANIANCSLIIDGTVDQTDTTVTKSTSQSFIKTLSNGDYIWNVNCTDSVNYRNSSGTRSLTVSYTAPVTVNSPGGGGGGSTTKKPAVIPEFDVDFSNATTGSLEVKTGDVKTFSFNGEIEHSIAIMTLSTNSVTLIIASDPIIVQLNRGETKQVDINKDGINDFEIKLVSISNWKANILLTKLLGADIVGKEEIEQEIRKEALFDVKVSMQEGYKEVLAGNEVTAKIEVLNVNNIGQVDVTVDYYLSDKNTSDNKTVLSFGSDVLAVEAVASFVRSLRVPNETKPGTYFFDVDISYKNFTTSSSAEFRVENIKAIGTGIVGISLVVIVIFVVFVLLIIAVSIIILRRREERLERELRSLKNRGSGKKWKKYSKNKKKERW
ncbi:MAG: VCBS repeat-containing protein [Candidatus Pacearchaeota archaeon]|nr:VCBS repeat-containing protein [Candidatus Pacearchaeota archaeon]